MKHITLIAFAILAQTNVLGQAIVGNSYVTITDAVAVYGVGSDGDIDISHNFKIPLGTKFLVTGFDAKNNIKITFWRFSPDISTNSLLRHQNDTSGREVRREIIIKKSVLKKEEARQYVDELEYIGPWANFKEFALPVTTFNGTCKLYYGKKNDFTWGVMTLPIKVRFGNNEDRFFNFEEKLNLGFNFGIRHQIQGRVEQSLNYLIGVGVTSVKTDSISLKNKIKPSSTSSTALSFNIGVLYQYETFQIGLFLGSDFIPEALGKDWRYQGKPWVGIAVGVSLYSRNVTQGGTTENK